MSIRIDGLRELVADMRKAPIRAQIASEKVLKRGAQNIKNDLQADASKSKHFKAISPTISYDRTPSGAYEIGPDKERVVGGKRLGKPGTPGNLANIAYFGGAHGGGGTLDIDGPLEREAPRLAAHLDKELGDLL